MDGLKKLTALGSWDLDKKEPPPFLDKACGTTTKCNLLKVLMGTHCKMGCKYCPLSAPQNRYAFSPQKMANIFYSLYKRGTYDGLFLSSGITDAEKNMEMMIETARILRRRYKYKGYLHLKILPGASRSSIKEAVSLSNRASINIETVSSEHLSYISPCKDMKNDILLRQKWLMDEVKNQKKSHTTQIIVGVDEESDLDIFNTMLSQYKLMETKRVYYSSFKPLRGTPFEGKSPSPLYKEHRFYQLDWLWRIYKFHEKELKKIFLDGMLPNKDPKITLARNYFEKPIEINHADKSELLRIPGIGPQTTEKIIGVRNEKKIRTMESLAGLGVNLKRALPFLRVDGIQQTTLTTYA
ncbi:helix-hairpin-helix domain-containing protein [Candidatus Micrarchaeota archaeon]|nr:helix-hairpin-helix domain-containing protein [Candidatus Micrarchaeota archaeon]